MINKLDSQTLSTLKLASQKLRGYKRRFFEAHVTKDYLGGSARKAERTFGWGRETLSLGLKEIETGIICLSHFSSRGRKRTESLEEGLSPAIEKLLENETQTDPKFQTDQRFCRISAQSICRLLEHDKGYESGTFKVRTMNDILNRLGYTLKKR